MDPFGSAHECALYLINRSVRARASSVTLNSWIAIVLNLFRMTFYISSFSDAPDDS